MPLYISDMIAKYELTMSLCSSSKRLIIVPWYKLKTYGRSAFSVNGPMLFLRSILTVFIMIDFPFKYVHRLVI